MGPLLERASDLSRAATALGAVASAGPQTKLRALLRSMNSHYTNCMEGEHTRPSDIERALQQDYSDNKDLGRRQRLAVSHIDTEITCEAQLAQQALAGQDLTRWRYSAPALTWLHQRLFQSLTTADLRLADGSTMKPGALRARGGGRPPRGTHGQVPALAPAALVRCLWPSAARRSGHRGIGGLTPPPRLDSPVSGWQRARGAAAHPSALSCGGPEQWAVVAAARFCAFRSALSRLAASRGRTSPW
jgi:hypothetical protein